MNTIINAWLCLAFLPAALSRQTARIVGGEVSADGSWPWMASLKYLGDHTCGATLMGGNWVLCAAHCAGQGTIELYEVQVGTNKRTCSDGWCVTAKPYVIIRHPDFIDIAGAGYPHDIAIIRWDQPYINEVEGKVMYSQLAVVDNQIGQECFITGWGRVDAGVELSLDLMEARMDVMTREQCEFYWSQEDIPISATQICVIDNSTFAKGSCNGDAGGPLVCRASTSDPWLLAGVNSWGRSGCDTSFPSVFTRVSFYDDWILDNAPPPPPNSTTTH